MNARRLGTLLFSITWLLVLPWNAQGRIGETLDECKARYGNPIKFEEDTALFSKQGIYVLVYLLKGKVDEISYYRNSTKDSKDSKKTAPPTDAEVQVLLIANAQNSKWELQGTYWHHALWINREHRLAAFRTELALTIQYI